MFIGSVITGFLEEKIMKKPIHRIFSLVICVIMLTMSLGLTAVYAASGTQSDPYTLSLGDDRFEFDGWGMYPAIPPSHDFVKNKIYKELGVNIIRVELYTECDENDKLVTSTEEFQRFITLVKQAKEFNLDYMISIWTPPVSMKDNGKLDNMGEDTGYLREDKEQAFCDYVVQVFDYLKEHSLPLPVAFSFANEPNNEREYQACDYYDGQMERVLKLFNTTFENNGYGDILICTPEQTSYSENYKTFSQGYYDHNNNLLEDDAYKQAYDVLAFHGYTWKINSERIAPIVKRSDSFMEGKEIWSTETGESATKSGAYTGLGRLLRKINYHTQIYEANRWIYWRGFADVGGYAFSLAEGDDSSVKTMATYYFLKALFNNVPAGSMVTGINTNDPVYDINPSALKRNTDLDLLDIGGYRTDGGQVFTLYNSTDVAKYYNVSGLTGNSILIYRFDNAGNIVHERVANNGSAYNGLCVNPGESVLFITGNDLSFGDDPVIGEDNVNKTIVENFVTEETPEVDSSNNSKIGTVWKADGSVKTWKTSRPDLISVRRDNAGFDDKYIVVKGRTDNVFAYTSNGPTLYGDKNWSIRMTYDLSQCSWRNTYGPADTYTTTLSTTFQPFNDPSSQQNNQEAFSVIITKGGKLRIAGGKNGSYFVYMADESKLNATNFDPMGIHTYTIDKVGSEIRITIDGILLGKLTKMAHISNIDIGYGNARVVDIPSEWGSDVTVTDRDGNSKTHKCDFDLTSYSPTLKYIAAANVVNVEGTNYIGLWQTTVYPGIKDLEIIEDTSLKKFPTFSGVSANINDEYSLLFNVDKSILESDEVESYTVKITNGNTLETYFVEKLEEFLPEDGYDSYGFNNINPSKLDDKITGMLVVNYKNGYSSSSIFSYSMKQYCYDKLNEFAIKGNLTEEEQKLKETIVAMLNYGAAVQTYTNRGLSSHELVDYRLNDEDKNISEPILNDIIFIEDDIDEPVVTWESVRLILSNSMRLRFFVDIPENVDVNSIKAVVDVEGNDPYDISGTDFKTENGKYYFETKNIGFLSIDKPIRVQIKSENSALSNTLTYSVESYASYHKEHGSDDGFDRVIDTMINFGNSIFE